MQRVQVWDLPLRVFHWLLAATVVAAVVTGQVGGEALVWHARLGLLIAGLLTFRLVWGVLGSTYARFARFWPTAGGVRAYLRGEWRGLGHNPLGALAVFALLGVLTVQVVCGLFANDDIAFTAPLFDLVGRELSDVLTRWHHKVGDLLLILVAVHVAAIVFYVRVRGQNLVRPMVSGWLESETEAAPVQGGGLLAVLLALGLAFGVMYLASGLWLPAAAASI